MGTADNTRLMMITAMALATMAIAIIALVLVVLLRPVAPPPPVATAAPVQAQATATAQPRILQEQPPAVPQGTVILVESQRSQQPDARATEAATTPIILEPVYGE